MLKSVAGDRGKSPTAVSSDHNETIAGAGTRVSEKTRGESSDEDRRQGNFVRYVEPPRVSFTSA